MAGRDKIIDDSEPLTLRGKFVFFKYVNLILKIGHSDNMEPRYLLRLYALNGFAAIAILFTVIFVVSFTVIGSYSSLEGLFIVPVSLTTLYLNHKRLYQEASFTAVFVMILLILLLALSDRRTGTEYLLVALAGSSVLLFDRWRAIFGAFLLASLCYGFYVWYDYQFPFIPDPTVPYGLTKDILLFMTAFFLVTESILFRWLMLSYAGKLETASDEVKTVNEELRVQSEQLDWIVRQKSRELQSYLEAININIWSALTDNSGVILKVNEPLMRITQYTESELIGKNARILNSGWHPDDYFKDMLTIIHSGKSWRGEIRNRAKDGSYFWLDMVILPIMSDDNHIQFFLSLALPITDRKIAEEDRERHARIFEAITYETSHKVRGPMARIQGIINLVESNNVRQEELLWLSMKLKENVIELDAATSNLTNFVNKHSQQKLQGQRLKEPH